MKLGIALPLLADSPHRYHELQVRLKAARRNRFHGVELQIDDPRMMSPGKIGKHLRAQNLELAAIGTGMTYAKYGLSFLDDRKEMRIAAIHRAEEYIRLASELDAPVILALIRGRYSARLGRDRAEDRLSRVLHRICRFADQAGVKTLLEAVNRYELNLIHTLADCTRMLASSATTNMKVLADTYHMNIEEDSPVQAIHSSGPQIGHVHLADCNRGAPGQGHIDFEALLRALKVVKYDDWVSAEIIFKPDEAQALRQASRTIVPLL